MKHLPLSRFVRPALGPATVVLCVVGLGVGSLRAQAAPLPPPTSVAPALPAVAPPNGAMAVPPAAKPAPVPKRKAQRSRPKRLSKATLAALQPVALPSAQATTPAAPPALAQLSPIVRHRAAPAEPASGAVTDSVSSLARALDTNPSASARPVSSQALPAQEEALALARQQAAPEVAAALPEEPGARVRKDVESGPMRLRVRRQAVQMSVEFPFQ